jgi:hypothetical protein
MSVIASDLNAIASNLDKVQQTGGFLCFDSATTQTAAGLGALAGGAMWATNGRLLLSVPLAAGLALLATWAQITAIFGNRYISVQMAYLEAISRGTGEVVLILLVCLGCSWLRLSAERGESATSRSTISKVIR